MASEPDYPCPSCGQQHSNSGALARHETKHVLPGGFLCSICKAPFTTTEARQMHKREAHFVYRCHVCRNKFSEEQEYRDHVKSVHTGNMKKPPEVCDSCGSQFSTKNQLRNHVESNCGTEKRFECEICKRSYQSSASLKSHKRSHQRGKTELCGFCGASFLHRGQLKIHERVHTGEKPYQCDKCDKAFGYRESLITHSTTHTGIKPFFCKCCDARFSCVGNLIKHRKLRPKTCGLPEYNPPNRVAPRPTKKTMPSLTDRKNSQNVPRLGLSDVKNVSDVTMVPSDLTRTIEIETRSSEPGIEYVLNDETAIMYEEDYDSEHDAEQLNANETIHDDQDDQLLEDTYATDRQLIHDSYEVQIHGPTSDNAFSDDTTIDKWDDAANDETMKQQTDFTEMRLPGKNGKESQDLEKHCSQNNAITHEKRPDTSKTLGQRNHIEVLTIKFIHDGKQSEDEKSENNDQTSLYAMSMTDGLGKDNHYCAVVNDTIDLEDGLKSERKETPSNNTSEEICVKPESSFLSADVQASPEISAEQLNILNTEKEKQELQAQLEIVRTNSVASSNTFACKLCPLQYTTAYLMARHLERVHNFQLDMARENLKFTKETVHDKRFRCKYCNLSYVNASRLKSHTGKHGPDGRLIHKCPVCVQYFETEELARQHALEQHRKRLVCDRCEKEFKEPDFLQQHVRYAHKGLKELRKQRYMCHRCGKYFISRNSMSDHERANCGQSPIYRCETCGKHYASFGSLKVHQTMHQNQLPYQCEYCQKRFRIKGQLKVHERSHTGEKPFRCEHCPKSFPYRESLLVHQVSHTGVKRFACSGCHQTFTCISNLQTHRRNHRATCGAVPNNTRPLKIN